MILNIIFILAALVALNFLLLIFSCNRTSKTDTTKASVPILKKEEPKVISNQLPKHQLAPTGS